MCLDEKILNYMQNIPQKERLCIICFLTENNIVFHTLLTFCNEKSFKYNLVWKKFAKVTYIWRVVAYPLTALNCNFRCEHEAHTAIYESVCINYLIKRTRRLNMPVHISWLDEGSRCAAVW